MSDFTFLTEEQIFGDKQLDILKKYGTSCALTDFSILLGGYVSSLFYTNEGNDLKDRAGYWWTKTSHSNNARVVTHRDTSNWHYVYRRDGGVRPALPYSSISKISSNEVRGKDGIKEILYGEYPQTVVDEDFSKVLENAYNNGNVKATGKSYTTDSVKYDDHDTNFNARSHIEYEFNGKKYIRFIGDENGVGAALSDGRVIKEGDPYWVSVEPIIWLVDEKEDMALSKKIIFSGVQFKNKDDYDGDFDKTDIKQFMDNNFSKDIIPSNNKNILDDIKLSLLSEEQVFGKNELDVIEKCGTKAAVTDLAIILGAYVDGKDNSKSDRTGWYWTKTSYNSFGAHIVEEDGPKSWNYVSVRAGGVRPALSYSLISKIVSNGERGISGIKEIKCGEYPQMVVDLGMQGKLSELKSAGKLSKTGRSYTFDSRKYGDYDRRFTPVTYEEYIFHDKKYINVKVNSSFNGKKVKLSSGIKVRDDGNVWIEVLPVEWLIDEQAGLAIAKKILVSGIRYDNQNKYDGNFEKTEMNEYLNKYMVKDIFQSVQLTNQESIQDEEIKQKVRRQNPYNFNFDDVSEEDIIRGAVESNVSVFLHGRSSEGKSARVKQLDPDCEIIYMRNATPDSLNGKSVYNASTGEMIDVPPTWYTKVKEKCEAEPDKIHIIFFDELTNALPSIQGMAFNIVLDGEVNGKWKLPDNARIVAAGNDLNDSLAANKLAEPLFNRFAHVYINTTVDDWLKWASTPKEKYERLDYSKEETEAKIHPSIYAYIAYKSYSGKDVLRTKYTGDKPNADPRKWEMASKVLYQTKQPEMLRALIGDDLTRDFAEFARQEVITVEDVINSKEEDFSDIYYEMNLSEKYATAVGLSSVSEENFEVVRNFMKILGAEPRAAFESMWAHGDEKRLEILAEMQMSDGGMKR